MFANLGHIRRLYLYHCDFSNFASNVFNNLVNLDYLLISNPKKCNHIQLNDLPRLKWLRLEVIGEEIPEFQNVNIDLQVLEFIYKDYVKGILEIIRECCFPKLRALKICGNNDKFDLECLSEKCQSKNEAASERNFILEYLSLSEFKEIKGSFSSFENLRSLTLSRIDAVMFQNGMFKGLTNLKSLQVDCLKTQRKHKVTLGFFDGLDNLEKLDLCCTNKFCKELFRNLSNLTELKLFTRDFSYIQNDAFSYLVRLENLYFKCSSEKSIRDGLFSPLKNLIELNLSTTRSYDGIVNCKISRNILKGLENLRVLGLYGIEIEDIDAFSSNLYLQRVELDYDYDKELIKNLEIKYPKVKFE